MACEGYPLFVPCRYSTTNPGRECAYCQGWQPLRAKHCHDCGRCVRRFDHHCAWVGNCIGEGNHRVFVFYLSAQLALLIWAAVQCVSAFGPTGSADLWILHQLHLLLAMVVRSPTPRLLAAICSTYF